MLARPRTAVFVLATAAVLLLVALLIVRPGPAPKPAQLPNPNGYDDFLKAGPMVTTNVGDYNILSNAALRALVATNAESLRLLRLGLYRQCAVRTDIYITNMSALGTEIGGMKRLSQLLAAEGLLYRQDNQPLQAAHTYLDAIRFGDEISRGGFLIHRLVGVAFEATGRVPLAQLAPTLTPQQAREVATELEKIDRTHVTWEEVWQGESRFTLYLMRRNPNPIQWVEGLWQTRALMKRASEKHNCIVAQERLLAAELAVRCYYADKARAPARLEDLVPGYLSKVPQDPFTGQPMTYRPQGTNWVLYSLGPDRADNGGRPVVGIAISPGDVLYNAP